MSETRKVWPWQEPDIRCEWAGECHEQATDLVRYGSGWDRPLCAEHRTVAQASVKSYGGELPSWPLVRDPRVVSLFCAGLFGVRDERLHALATDPDGAQVLLDYAEERGMHLEWYRWPAQEPREWLEVGWHGDASSPHVWMTVERDPHLLRCPCGMYEHEYGRIDWWTEPWRRWRGCAHGSAVHRGRTYGDTAPLASESRSRCRRSPRSTHPSA